MTVSLKDAAFSEGMETLYQLAKHPSFTDRLAKALRKPDAVGRAIRALNEELLVDYGKLVKIKVPNCSANQLFERAERRGVNIPDFMLRDWDFDRDEGGRTFDVMFMADTRNLDHQFAWIDDCSYLKLLGFEGNMAAFVAWIAQSRSILSGYYESPLPEEHHRPMHCHRLSNPFYKTDGMRLGFGRPNDCVATLVVFREVKK